MKSLQQEIDTLRSAVLQEAEWKRAKNDKFYNLFTILTYILFGVSWIVGVVGVIVGDEDEAFQS